MDQKMCYGEIGGIDRDQHDYTESTVPQEVIFWNSQPLNSQFKNLTFFGVAEDRFKQFLRDLSKNKGFLGT